MASLKNALLEPDQPPEGFELPEGLEAVAICADFNRAGEVGLTILAMGRAYWTIPHENGFLLCVATADREAVSEELRAVAALERGRVLSGAPVFHEFKFGWSSFIIFGLVLVGCFIWQQLGGLDAAGRTDSVAMVAGGEWARALTALTLHGDVVHLLSNLVAGLGFALCVARFFGAGIAWFLIAVCGFFGNVLNAWVKYPEVHYSIGASTAVFAALGLLTGIGFFWGLGQKRQSWLMPCWLIPIFAGLTLLGLVGIGDGTLYGRVDVAAHISGFACGFVCGLLGAMFQGRFVALQPWGGWLGLLTPACLAVAWLIQLGLN